MKKLLLLIILLAACYLYSAFSADVDLPRGRGGINPTNSPGNGTPALFLMGVTNADGSITYFFSAPSATATNAQAPSAVLSNLVITVANNVTNANVNQFTINAGILNARSGIVLTNATNWFSSEPGAPPTNRIVFGGVQAGGELSPSVVVVDRYGNAIDIFTVRVDPSATVSNILYIGLGSRFFAMAHKVHGREDGNIDPRYLEEFMADDGSTEASGRYFRQYATNSVGWESFISSLPGGGRVFWIVHTNQSLQFGDDSYFMEQYGASWSNKAPSFFATNVTIRGTNNIFRDLNVSNNLWVGGTVTFPGNMSASGTTLFDTGNMTINSPSVSINGLTFFNNDFSVSAANASFLSGILGINSQTVFSNQVRMRPFSVPDNVTTIYGTNGNLQTRNLTNSSTLSFLEMGDGQTIELLITNRFATNILSFSGLANTNFIDGFFGSVPSNRLVKFFIQRVGTHTNASYQGPIVELLAGGNITFATNTDTSITISAVGGAGSIDGTFNTLWVTNWTRHSGPVSNMSWTVTSGINSNLASVYIAQGLTNVQGVSLGGGSFTVDSVPNIKSFVTHMFGNSIYVSNTANFLSDQITTGTASFNTNVTGIGTNNFKWLNATNMTIQTLNVSTQNIGYIISTNYANIRTNIGSFDIVNTNFIINTRYTNGSRRATVTMSGQLSAAAAGTATISLIVEQGTTITNKATISAGPLASLVTIEQLTMRVPPDARYYFTNETSGTGASVSLTAGTGSIISE